jgi:hypothetical protein
MLYPAASSGLRPGPCRPAGSFPRRQLEVNDSGRGRGSPGQRQAFRAGLFHCSARSDCHCGTGAGPPGDVADNLVLKSLFQPGWPRVRHAGIRSGPAHHDPEQASDAQDPRPRPHRTLGDCRTGARCKRTELEVHWPGHWPSGPPRAVLPPGEATARERNPEPNQDQLKLH